MAQTGREEYEREVEERERRIAKKRPFKIAGIVAAALGAAVFVYSTAKSLFDDGVVAESFVIAEQANRVLSGETIPESPQGAAGVILEIYTPESSEKPKELIARYDPNNSLPERLSALEKMCLVEDTRYLVGYNDQKGYDYWIQKLKQISDENSGDGAKNVRALARDMADSLLYRAGFDSTTPFIDKQNEKTRIEKIGHERFEVILDYYDMDGKLVEEGATFTSEYDPTKSAGERQRAIGTFYDQQKKSPEGMIYTGRVRKESITAELIRYIGEISEFDGDTCVKLRTSDLLLRFSRSGDFSEADPNICNSLANN